MILDCTRYEENCLYMKIAGTVNITVHGAEFSVDCVEEMFICTINV